MSSPTPEPGRPGLTVTPVERLSPEQLRRLHDASMEILDNPGLLVFNEAATDLFSQNGCPVRRADRDDAWSVRIPEKIVRNAIESAPKQIKLGARDPANTLWIDAEQPRSYFGTGSETNIVLETELRSVADGSDSEKRLVPVYSERRGCIQALCDSARLCNALDRVDFFIRNVNIQDEGIDETNKDVNVFFASLLYMTKHVQAGLTHLPALDSVLRMASIIAGGPEALAENPILSFIACLTKSPLQMVEDTGDKVLELARRRLPMVISSSPQGGSTAPIQEEGIGALINAEILSGVTLTQLAQPGTPVFYGAVPVRARMDNLYDFYGAPEFSHYNVNCVQLARSYGLPCYSTAGCSDVRTPGIQATVERLLSHTAIAQSGAQYIHNAFGLVHRTNTFCPLQAVIDDANLAWVKEMIRRPAFDDHDVGEAVAEIRKVMQSGMRLFARGIRKQRRRGVVSEPYRFETTGTDEEVLERAHERLSQIRATPGQRLSDEQIDQIYRDVPGLFPREHFNLEHGE